MEGVPQAYYQTTHPLHDFSHELEGVFRSLKRITLTADYRIYDFPLDAGVNQGNLGDPSTLALAADSILDTRSKSGTAVVLARTPQGVLLLTNFHVAHYPLLQLQYFDDGTGGAGIPRTQRPVASASIRFGQRGYLADHPNLGPFQIVASDSAVDLAILEVRLGQGLDFQSFAPIPVDIGNSRRLSWGSFVIVAGYPRGYPLATRGMVSDPNRDGAGGFLTDGLWNEGVSGGVILGVRGETGRMEWVGVARAGAGAQEVRVLPRLDDTLHEPGLVFRYEGPLLVESLVRLQYGITFSVPMATVRDFVGRHRIALQSRGYDLRRY
ncbi:MAG: serine protease [Gemmatimonadota bacterium]